MRRGGLRRGALAIEFEHARAFAGWGAFPFTETNLFIYNIARFWKMKIFDVYFAHTFPTGTLGPALLRRGTSQRRGTSIFVIRGSNSTRECVIFPEFAEKILHVIFHVKRLSLR